MLEGEEHNCGKGILGKTAGKALQWPRFNLEEVGVVYGGGGLSIRRVSSRQVVAQAAVPLPPCRTSQCHFQIWGLGFSQPTASFPPLLHCSPFRATAPKCLELLSQMSHWGFPFLCLGLLAEAWWHSWSHNCAYCLGFFSCFAAFYEYSPYGFPLQGAVLFPYLSPVSSVYFFGRMSPFLHQPPSCCSPCPMPSNACRCPRAQSRAAVVNLGPAPYACHQQCWAFVHTNGCGIGASPLHVYGSLGLAESSGFCIGTSSSNCRGKRAA